MNSNPNCTETIDEIKIELIKRRLSQRTLARELGISPQLLSGVLNRTIRSLPVEIKLINWLCSPNKR